jgi:hypothetical protein
MRSSRRKLLVGALGLQVTHAHECIENLDDVHHSIMRIQR